MTTTSIVFIDSRVADYQSLIAGLPDGAEWYLLDAGQDGVRQMAGIVANYRINGFAFANAAWTPTLHDTTWTVVGNGDGKSDILLRHTDGTMAIWQMNGTTQGGVGLFGAPTTWSIVDAASDLSGDGKSDIFLRHSDGTMAIWQMNSATQQGTVGLFGAPTAWAVTTGTTLNGGTFTGGDGAEALTGTVNNDFLNGFAGNDTLTGGLGNDLVVFNTPLNPATNLDTITYFATGSDRIQLENAIFTSLTAAGDLNSDFFRSGPGITSAADANDFLIYNSSTGDLYYDPDGNGAAAATKGATLWNNSSTHPALSAGDFVVS